MEFYIIVILIACVLYKIVMFFMEKDTRKKPKKRKDTGDWKDIYTKQFEKEHGPCSNRFFGEKFTILAFNETRTLLINTTPVLYDKITLCKVDECKYTSTDYYYKIQEAPVYETRTNTSSMAGRAIVGGVIAGPLGAVIGGATAKKETTVKTKESLKEAESTYTVNGYKLDIFIDNITKPSFELITKDECLIDEIKAFLVNNKIPTEEGE